ncbi:MAG: hypothetical protein WA051_02010 [Minisyncoccia bacterium]
MNKNEGPVMPPDGEGSKGRFESSDLDIEQLGDYLKDTAFESEDEIVETLSDRYKMVRNEELGEIVLGMTQQMSTEAIKRVINGEKVDTDEFMQPLSGHKPRAVLRIELGTIGGARFDLRVFEVFNRNQKFRFEYILKPVEELDNAR